MTRRVIDHWSRKAGRRPTIVCDNTMLGPVFQKPIELGADICIYSLTKYVGGHSDLIAGGITGSRELLKPIRLTRSAFGFQLDPHSSWMLSRSLETLSLRMERAAQSASQVAAWLAGNTLMPCQVLHALHREDAKEAEVFRAQCSGPGSTFSFVVDDDRSLAFFRPERIEHLQTRGQPGRHGVACLPPGFHDPLGSAAGESPCRRHHRWPDPPVNRIGAPRRPHRGFETGFPQTRHDSGP